MEDSDSLIKAQLGLLRSRLRKVADNLFQITNNARSIEWSLLMEKMNMAVSHLDALAANNATDTEEAGCADFQSENASLLANVLVLPVIVTPDPLTIPSVLLRKRPIPEVEELHQGIVLECAEQFSIARRDEIVCLHDEMLKHDQELVGVLDWLEARKSAFNEVRKQTNASLMLVQHRVSKDFAS